MQQTETCGQAHKEYNYDIAMNSRNEIICLYRFNFVHRLLLYDLIRPNSLLCSTIILTLLFVVNESWLSFD